MFHFLVGVIEKTCHKIKSMFNFILSNSGLILKYNKTYIDYPLVEILVIPTPSLVQYNSASMSSTKARARASCSTIE
jgi:hypothetical protein